MNGSQPSSEDGLSERTPAPEPTGLPADRLEADGGAEEQGSLRKRTLSGIKWQSIAIGGGEGARMVVRLILASLLLPADFGLVGLVRTITAFMMIFGDLGLSAAIIQRRELSDRHLSSVFYLNVTGGAILTALCFLLAGPLAGFYEKEALKPLLQCFSVYFLVSSFGLVQIARLKREMAFRKYAVVWLVAQAVFTAVALPMALTGFGAWSLVGGNLATAAAMTGGVWMAARWRPRHGFSWSAMKGMFGYSSGIALSSLMNQAGRGIDVLVAGKAMAAGPLGLYTFSVGMTRLASAQFTRVISQVMFPAFSRVQHLREKVVAAYLRASRYLAVVNVPIAVMIYFGARPLLVGMLGAKWEDAVILVQVLSIYALMTGIGGGLWAALIKGLGHSYLSLVLNSIRVVALGLSVFVGARWGPIGVAVGVVGYSVVFRFVYQAIVNYKVGMTMWDYLRAVGPGLVCGAVAFGSAFFLVPLVGRNWPALLQLAWVFVAVCGTHVLALRMLFPKTSKEFVGDVRAMIRSRRTAAPPA